MVAEYFFPLKSPEAFVVNQPICPGLNFGREDDTFHAAVSL
jgi:hypothetical protein